MTIRRALAIALCGLGASRVSAQTVDPPIATSVGPAKSSFLISNNCLYPLSFVIEPRGFEIASCGDLGFRPVDTTAVRVRLSTMSGRLAARQQRRIQYEITTDSLPDWVAFVVTFGPAGRGSGLGTRLELVHFAYLMQRTPVQPADLVIRGAAYDSTERRLTVTLENRSDKLTRLLSLTVIEADGRERAVEACPVFPRSTRVFIEPAPVAPLRVVLRFPGFTLEAPVTTGRLASPDSTRPPLR